MTDYLSNLAARSFGRTENIAMVKPRVPSLFEPAEAVQDVSAEAQPPSLSTKESDCRRAVGLSQESDEQPEPGMSAQQWPHGAGNPPAPISPRDSRRNRYSTQIGPATARRNTIDTGQDVSVQAPVSPVELPGLRQPAISSMKDIKAPIEGLPVRGDCGTIGTLADTVPHRIERPGKTVTSVAAQSETALRPIQSLLKSSSDRKVAESSLPGEEGRRTTVPARSSEHAAREQEVALSLSTARKLGSPIEPTLRTWPALSPRTEAPRPESTIHVTIGRIEVRAVPPAVRSHPKPKTKEPLSLDEYLRGRNGDGR